MYLAKNLKVSFAKTKAKVKIVKLLPADHLYERSIEECSAHSRSEVRVDGTINEVKN